MNGKKLAFVLVSIALMLTLLAGGVFGQAVKKDNIYRYLSIFTEVFSLVRSNYVEEVESDKLVAGAFDGLTNAVDEYSYYVPPALMAKYADYADPATSGVGLVISRRLGYGYVVSTLEGSPARAAGIEAGDFIEQIDGKPTQDMALWQLRGAIHGPANSRVELTVLKGAMNKRETISLRRQGFAVPPVEYRTIQGAGYVRVPFFSKESPAQLTAALAEAANSRNPKLIIDVRGNADGSIASAIRSADALLGKGTITALKGRRIEAKSWSADPAVAFQGTILVLIDSSTTGAAEIFASALRGNGAARLVGVRTYGKAIEQKFVELPSGGGLLVTVGNYTTPTQEAIGGEGLRPDVLVDLTPLALRDENDTSEKPDLILERALAVINETATEKAAA